MIESAGQGAGGLTPDSVPADGAADGRGLAAPFHVPALDGLRAIAFLLVFASHSVPRSLPIIGPVAASGWSGVDVFFTLSGFLVTYLLLREEAINDASDQAGQPDGPRFSLPRFWSRRTLRIWPLYFLALAVAFFLLPHLPSPWSLGPEAGSASHAALVETYQTPAWLFLFNWAVVGNGWHDTFSFGTLWSISVEEQFYLLWPLVLWVTPRRHRLRATAAALVTAIAVRSILMAGGRGVEPVYVHTFLRADALLGGALLAQVVVARGGDVPRPPKWLAPAAIAAFGYQASFGDITGLSGLAASLRFVLIDAVAVALVWTCLAPGLFQRVIAARPLTLLGRISYGLYVWHLAILNGAAVLFAGLRHGTHTGAYHAARVSTALAVTIGLAWLTFTFVERPFLKLKQRFA
jgi:peptidoglycan/LPS O-acetylase OafA/YrhL